MPSLRFAPPFDWQHILVPHGWVGYIRIMQNRAIDAGYPYFSWNGRIYHTDSGIDTGVLARDVPLGGLKKD
jgi:hypothetical protein